MSCSLISIPNIAKERNNELEERSIEITQMTDKKTEKKQKTRNRSG